MRRCEDSTTTTEVPAASGASDTPEGAEEPPAEEPPAEEPPAEEPPAEESPAEEPPAEEPPAEEPPAEEADEAAEGALDETDEADVFKVSPSVEKVSHQCPATGTTIWDKVKHMSMLSHIWMLFFKPLGSRQKLLLADFFR